MSNILLIITPLAGFEPSPEEIRLTKKFLDGIQEYVDAWPGKVHVIMPPGSPDSGNLDDIILEKNNLRFHVEVLNFSSPLLREKLKQARIVLGGPHHQLSDLASHCRTNNIPYIFNCEYTLKTRLQIAKEETPNKFSFVKRCLWEIREEYRNIQQVKLSSAVQCNGFPTYNTYKNLNKDVLVYLDNRISPEMLASELEIEKKYGAATFPKRRMQLAYSGRINKMKGAHYLIPLARYLDSKKLNFQLHIFGSGPLLEDLKRQIIEFKLEEVVIIHGVVDFKLDLVPYITQNIDLFICPHPQGDPACTYIETLACGVPIAGFSNEALKGIVEATHASWDCSIGDIEALGDLVINLKQQPEILMAAAMKSLRFASEHTFEVTFKNRMDQIKKAASVS